MSTRTINISAQSLVSFVTAIFEAAGCRDAGARDMAECLVQTNLWGIDSHGVLRTPEYLKRFQNGAMNMRPEIRTLKQGGSLEVLDADNAAGYVAAKAAMSRAIGLAKTSNIAAVGIINSNHCGAASLYARMALEHGMIGIAMSNVAPNMVAPGGSKPITGNNPIAAAIPTFAEFPFVFDISLSAVSGGKILVAAKNGEQIPLGWATDREGHPTTDPNIGFKGFLLPVGGHKGFGLSLLVDILCGVITGGSFQHQLKSMYVYPQDPSNTAHLMLVINPLCLMSKADLRDRMAKFFETVKQSPMWDTASEMLLPGEIEYRMEKERRLYGIPIPAPLYTELVQIGKDMQLDAALGMVTVEVPEGIQE